MWINNMGGEGVMELGFGTAGYQDLAQRKTGINRSKMWETKTSREVMINQIGAEGVLAMRNKDRMVVIAVTMAFTVLSILITQGYRLGAGAAVRPSKVSEAEALPAPRLFAEAWPQHSIGALQAARDHLLKKDLQAASRELNLAAMSFQLESNHAAETARLDLLLAAGNLEQAASDLNLGVAISVETINDALLAAYGVLANSSSLPPQARAQINIPARPSSSLKP